MSESLIDTSGAVCFARNDGAASLHAVSDGVSRSATRSARLSGSKTRSLPARNSNLNCATRKCSRRLLHGGHYSAALASEGYSGGGSEQLSAAAVLGAIVNDAAASGSPKSEPSYAASFTTVGVPVVPPHCPRSRLRLRSRPSPQPALAERSCEPDRTRRALSRPGVPGRDLALAAPTARRSAAVMSVGSADCSATNDRLHKMQFGWSHPTAFRQRLMHLPLSVLSDAKTGVLSRSRIS